MDRSCSLVIPLASRLSVIWMIWQPPVRTMNDVTGLVFVDAASEEQRVDTWNRAVLICRF